MIANLGLTQNPFRIFFPVAWAMGLWGVLVWALFHFGWIPYPGVFHPQAMMGGFILGHVLGFLLTAGPRFTGTGPLHPLELTLSFTLFMSVVIASLAQLPNRAVFALMFLALAAAALILARRFLERRKSPPDEFIHLPFGMIAALIGSLSRVYDFESEAFARWGGILIYEAFILSLVLGIGGRLGPFLMHGGADPSQGQHAPINKWSLRWPLAIFWFSTLAEATADDSLIANSFRTLRAAIVLYVLVRDWKVFRAPRTRSAHAWGIWASAWMLPIGLFGSAWSETRVHALHLFYVGGLGLLTLMIATRVLLAHGSRRLLFERKVSLMSPVILGTVVAAWTRWSAGLSADIYFSHLTYAAILWVLALGYWGAIFLKEGWHQPLGFADD
ncbi:MAG TPA: NnrS family protein [Pseudobdellovibrionaceae bacterium]|nr:NnrS family protein [Pseudobdellovibrionaceae bacterium]